MPLFDHFHRPLSETHQWIAFHSRWATAIADDLNRRLPRRFLAEAPFSLGSSASADVAETDQATDLNGAPSPNGARGGVAVAVEPITYTPPAAALVMPASFPKEVLVEIRDLDHARRVLGVVELVSPGNKDDEPAKRAFAGKCLSYLGKGLGLVVIDIVTERLGNLHNALVQLAGHGEAYHMADAPPIYACAYRPVRRKNKDLVDMWPHPLTVGARLPELPLALLGIGCVRLDLEGTYLEACDRTRIP
jgi:hypothetical protein